MEEKEYSISGLYYNYKKLSDDQIREYLNNITFVVLKDNGVNSVYGYYPLSKESMDKIKQEPRRNSLTFDATKTEDTPITNLKEFKKITFLCKSSSRFYLKPDIGEILDQISYFDLCRSQKIKAIRMVDGNYETLPDTGDEHHLMQAVLLTEEE